MWVKRYQMGVTLQYLRPYRFRFHATRIALKKSLIRKRSLYYCAEKQERGAKRLKILENAEYHHLNWT